jgi:hypothetical protein
MTSSSNKRRFTRLLAATLALGTIAAEPAFALCNPGSPNCIKVWPGSRLANIKNQLANPGTLGSNEIEWPKRQGMRFRYRFCQAGGVEAAGCP